MTGTNNMLAAVTNMELTEPERDALANYEVVIERGLATFYEVGNALMVIRAERLYRETHPTFEAYVADRWGMSDRHARRLVESAGVVTDMQAITGPMGPVPTTERQARELTGLPPEVAVKVMKAATEETDKPTARAIKAARESVVGPPPRPTLRSVPSPDRTPVTSPRKPSRPPLTDEMRGLMVMLEKVAHRAEKIAQDDRLPRHREHFRGSHSGRIFSITATLLGLISGEEVAE